MPNCILTPLTDESVITYTQLSGVQGVDIQSHAGFVDVTGGGMDNSGLSHDESFGVDDITQEPILLEVSIQEPIVAEVSNEVPIVEEVGTQEFSVEDVVVEDYVSSREDGQDAEQGNGQDDESAPTDGQ
ncbi:hypothetical protein Tco_1579290, partial [Tanacetum coccineum]